ncbi:phage antirepressor KilAC domain-containing protein [Clostridium beijerinckii]|uniref:phage antirepressor KilAC domain-containing protein n=1 Tax=Clostridium beijerinckii TaxID=1520 RepID=UPI00156FB9EF|nr:phage antirepressor KilAC domain-containing protein [Clostridium beijerinckii]NRU52453.1 phage antirepressor YoqD-like protein [Clostridium beijerinckii]NYC69102.1 phage antirepressor YoqD-like protein [Clostridium beijerinckii]
MEENKIIKLFTGEKVKTKDREFTKVLGGFSENNPVITVKQISELLDKEVKHINERINANIHHFNNTHIIDLKVVDQTDYNLEVLKTLGFTNMQISKAKNIYILSEAGFLLYLKFAEGDKAVELYKDFIEDYFKTKAENIVMEKTLEESKQTIIDERKYILGSVIFETDTTKKMELLERDRKLETQLNEIEKTLAKQELMEQVQDQLVMAEAFSKSNKEYSIDTLSRFFNIKGMGRNNFYKWMRDEKILMSNNQPYQKFMDDFHVIPVTNNRFADSKTLIKAKGVSYIVKKLIKDGKIQSKSYAEIINNINENLQEAI